MFTKILCYTKRIKVDQRGFVWAPNLRVSIVSGKAPWLEFKVRLQCICCQKSDSNEHQCLAHFILFIHSRTLTYGTVLLTFLMDLSTSINLTQKIPQRHALRFVSMVIRNGGKLTTFKTLPFANLTTEYIKVTAFHLDPIGSWPSYNINST